MGSRNNNAISVEEAVETLSTIAEMEVEVESRKTFQDNLLEEDRKPILKPVFWLDPKNHSENINQIKSIFRVILNHLQHFYHNESAYWPDPNKVEAMKVIMLLVGDAAQKIDKLNAIQHFSDRVTDLKEFQQLQDFYFSKIARRIDEGVLGKWILGLAGHIEKEPSLFERIKVPEKPLISESKHVFVDLDSVKKDAEYELFFIHKEDGSRFFSPRLLRNMKLVCDFGSSLSKMQLRDPLESVELFIDRLLHAASKRILKRIEKRLPAFYESSRRVREDDLKVEVKKAVLALMLCSHPHHLAKLNPTKCCTEYFMDFQTFFRAALRSHTYQKWLAYPPNGNNIYAMSTMDLLHELCLAFYIQAQQLSEVEQFYKELIAQGQKHPIHIDGSSWGHLAESYKILEQLFKHHSGNPLKKVLNLLELGESRAFDPIFQQNYPQQLYDIMIGEHKLCNLRIPTPIYQESIHKAEVLEEFKTFIHALAQNPIPKNYLLINLQNRTTWLESARCVALEELQRHPDFRDGLTVVTLAIDTDFIKQQPPYNLDNQADIFLEQFKTHLLGSQFGFYFPSKIAKEKLTGFIEKALKVTHTVFFSSKNVLTQQQRIDFIDFFYLILQLKLIDMVKPDSFSITCKDGLDLSLSYNASLFVLLKLMSPEGFGEADQEYLDLMVHAPILLNRARLMQAERFDNLISLLKIIDHARDTWGKDQFAAKVKEAFGGLFDTPVFDASLLLPKESLT